MRIDEALALAARQHGRRGYFFDFDGTLAAIQADPATVAPVPGVVDALIQLSQAASTVAIVSARPVDFLASRFGAVPGLTLYGLYGLEQMTVGGRAETHPDALGSLPTIAELVRRARAELPADVGVEDKRISVALHYRTAPHRQAEIEQWAATQAAAHGLRRQDGRMVVELKPPVAADKGTVVATAAADLDAAWYFGDDVADLAAFAALDELAGRVPGFTRVRVAIKHPELAGELAAAADLMVDSPAALADFLRELVSRTSGATRRQPDILPAVRVSDAERNVIAEQLRDAFADGRLDDSEFDVRIHAALTARTTHDLEHLLDDLGPAAGTARLPSPAPTRELARPEHRWTVAVCGSNERKGRWRVPESTTSVAVMAGTLLDLRTASLTSPVTTIRVFALMGGVDVVVPPGVRVEVSGFGLMGGLDDRVVDEELPMTAPVVRVKWFACMGGVSVRTKRPRRASS